MVKFWKAVAKADNKTWLRYQYIAKISLRLIALLLATGLLLVLILKSPENLEGFTKGLSLLTLFGA